MIKKIFLVMFTSLSAFAAAPSLVEVTKLVKSEVNPLQKFIGSAKFEKSSVLAAQNSGVVKSINFKLGDNVSKGKTLVQIDADLLNSQISAVRANLNVAKQEQRNSSKDFIRYKRLLASKSITQKEYDDALLKSASSKGNVKALQANLNELLIQANKKRIKAPFSGVIVEKNINIGEWANAGSAIAKIVDTNSVEFIFNVPLNVVNNLKVGDIYDIKVANESLKATLSAIIPNGDKLTRTFPVKFVANSRGKFIFDGQEAQIELSKNSKTESLVAPRDAVIKRFGQNVVFFINDKNQAMMLPVQIIGYVDNKVAIAGQGLNAGMDIVVKGNERVFPNSPVKVLNK